jgi:hypothetical protein
MDEIALVAGGDGECASESDSESGNTYAGVSDVSKIGDDIIEAYEGVVAATSHIIERVANAL